MTFIIFIALYLTRVMQDIPLYPCLHPFPRSFSFQKSPTPSQKPQTSVSRDLHHLLRSSILPTFITCNAPFQHGQLWTVTPDLQSQPTSANNHSCYNKSSTCRSCSYSSPSSPSPHWHPCQVYMIFLLQGEGDRFLNPESTHVHHHTSSSLC